MDRRAFLRRALVLLVLGSAPRALAAEAPSNFRTVYGDPKLRDRFFLFLQNVFHLYPEDRFHQLLIELTGQLATDEEIYRALLERLPELDSLLSGLSYGLPALRRQKAEMTRQTLEFIDAGAPVDGYLEIGTTGRYLGELRGELTIDGPVYLLNDLAPSYSLTDVLERGQLLHAGAFLPLGNYDAFAGDRIPDESLDLVTNFIGFHHCPTPQLAGFVDSIRRVLRPGGRLLLRDHDVDGAGQEALVALAHDVFNAGFFLSWETNHEQVRLFRSIDQWSRYLAGAGFVPSERRLAQEHDPTRNLVLEFIRG